MTGRLVSVVMLTVVLVLSVTLVNLLSADRRVVLAMNRTWTPLGAVLSVCSRLTLL